MKKENATPETTKAQTGSRTVRKKSPALLVIGAGLLIAGILTALYTYRSSYQASLLTSQALTEVKEQIKAIDAGTASGDLDALHAQKSQLSSQKLAQERPYSYSLILLFFAVLLTLKGLYNVLVGSYQASRADIQRLAQAGLLAALCYIGFTFLKIDIPVGPDKTAFHFGNVFCVLAALLIGGYWGGLAGAVGMTIADLTTSYVTSAPKTFLLKLCIGLIVGLVAHRICKLDRDHSRKYVIGTTVLSCFCGMLFNVIADPLVGYFYKMYLLGLPQDLASTLAKWSSLTTSFNAVIAVAVASLLYLALRPALKKAGLFVTISQKKEDGRI